MTGLSSIAPIYHPDVSHRIFKWIHNVQLRWFKIKIIIIIIIIIIKSMHSLDHHPKPHHRATNVDWHGNRNLGCWIQHQTSKKITEETKQTEFKYHLVNQSNTITQIS